LYCVESLAQNRRTHQRAYLVIDQPIDIVVLIGFGAVGIGTLLLILLVAFFIVGITESSDQEWPLL